MLWYLEIFYIPPQFRQLSYTQGAIPWMFSLPYGASSTLGCDSLRSEVFFDPLMGADLLEEFTCSVGPNDNNHPVLLTTLVTHKHLQILRLVNHSCTHFIHLLRLPFLQDLLLHNDIDSVKWFLAYSSSLRRFSTGVEIPALSIDWFSAIPDLADITISYSPSSFFLDLFSRLNRTQDPGLLPHLQSLAMLKYPLHGRMWASTWIKVFYRRKPRSP
ncbi:hypothetical protein MSAN_02337100 [Mycena sanguinolenta]|uniref:Uncharacterized protein n=1 Tax=Mycena sanguinolenta TaxID=230812 RepID=A0A8H6X6S5_9AGAR|nr:hypothetical protein MSAN_02337100 [Mycena sanguinolenta]